MWFTELVKGLGEGSVGRINNDVVTARRASIAHLRLRCQRPKPRVNKSGCVYS